KVRGRCLAAGRVRQRADRSADDRMRAEGAPHLWFAIGGELARMHSAAAPELGLAARNSYAPSAASRSFDVATLYRGSESESWEAFTAGYSEHDDTSAAAIHALNPADLNGEQRSREHFGVERPERFENVAVELCTHKLQDRGEIRDAMRDRLRWI